MNPAMGQDLAKMSLAQIREWAAGQSDESACRRLEADARAGAREFGRSLRRRLGRLNRERALRERMLVIEDRLRAQGAVHIAGVDEAGRGPLAGPVVAAAVVLSPDAELTGLDDSKKLSPARRKALFDMIREQAISHGIGIVQSGEVDRLNVLQASLKAMRDALAALDVVPDRVLVDGNQLPGSGLRELAFVDGDARSLSIAAASVLAKVTRDRMMEEYDRQYPGYGFGRNKGYGSAGHLDALQRLGPCPIHRSSFSPVGEKQLDLDLRGDGRRRVGRRGERLAVELLRGKGYRILDRNFRAGGAEIDIIASKGEVIAFVEVKTDRAGGFGGPAARVDREKQRRLAEAARTYLSKRDIGDLAPRFDVIAVQLKIRGHESDHFEGAFRLR